MALNSICELGKSVIRTEAEMINSLLNRIDENFVHACNRLLNCAGKIIVIGVGKSGHIGKKIAATFASTGSPAFFIHPNEAMHGDLGMITKNDIVLAISNSGQSEEIVAILPNIKRLGIPLITLTGNSHSSLAKAATVNIDVSVAKEACPLGLAPTSSTTATLVMGDALAMVLLDVRGFTRNDFAFSHPGGSLGKRLLLSVNEIMHKDDAIPVISSEATLKEALLEMTRKKLGMTTIVDQAGQLKGVFTDGDVRRTFDDNVALSAPIEHVMSAQPKTIPADMLAADALNIMEKHKITSLVVVDDKKRPIGITHIHDIFRELRT